MLNVVLHTPAGHREYAGRAVADSLRRGEAPLSSQTMYDDEVLGLEAVTSWSGHAERLVFYCDLGADRDMVDAVKAWAGPYELRWLDPEARLDNRKMTRTKRALGISAEDESDGSVVDVYAVKKA